MGMQSYTLSIGLHDGHEARCGGDVGEMWGRYRGDEGRYRET